jgi:hypothetical protein
MADKHPYVSGSAGIVQAVNHLRKQFPAQVTAETLRKLGIARNNETYVINILRFMKIIDDEGKETEKAGSVFTKHDDQEFQKGLADMLEEAYSDLFEHYGEETWDLATDRLISFFRESDHTSAIVGQRQASTFQTLAALSGHGEVTVKKSGASNQRTAKKQTKMADNKTGSQPKAIEVAEPGLRQKSRDVGLTVRIEINLPAAADQETYDMIFKSIRENLLNAE